MLTGVGSDGLCGVICYLAMIILEPKMMAQNRLNDELIGGYSTHNPVTVAFFRSNRHDRPGTHLPNSNRGTAVVRLCCFNQALESLKFRFQRGVGFLLFLQ